MNKRSFLLCAALVVGALPAAHAQHWGYKGEAGPENWSKLDQK